MYERRTSASKSRSCRNSALAQVGGLGVLLPSSAPIKVTITALPSVCCARQQPDHDPDGPLSLQRRHCCCVGGGTTGSRAGGNGGLGREGGGNLIFKLCNLKIKAK